MDITQPVDLLGVDAGYLAEMIWNALRETVVSAFHGMAWLQDCARIIASEGPCVSWTVPVTGLPVTQAYTQFDIKRTVTTVLAGNVFKPAVYEERPEADAAKQASAIAPNVVHSLDAAALMLTVAKAAAEGVPQFGMIHDSYATTPAFCPVLAACTREAFVELYSGGVVENLRAQFAAQAVTEFGEQLPIPDPPERGDLDLTLVLQSDYFFA